MSRRVFFSFHYENDVWRANQVRNSWVTQGKEAAGFVDAAEFERVEKGGEEAIKRWINAQLDGTSVTVVLIGSETSKRQYVKYEIQRSYVKGNALIGVYINQCGDKDGKKSEKGDCFFGEIAKDSTGKSIYFNQIAKIYDYVEDNGFENLGFWIEVAARAAGR